MLRIVAIILLIAVATVEADAQRTTRGRLKPAQVERMQPVVEYDTVAVAGDGQIVFSGYEKVLRATKESFFVTNLGDRDFSCLTFVIDYKDMDGRMLDSRRETVKIEIPAGETRKIDIPSWDKQKVFYYYRSPQPKTAQATAYKVKIRLVAATKEK